MEAERDIGVNVVQINERYIRRILAELIRINSVNPAFSGGTTSERAIAEYVDAALTRLGGWRRCVTNPCPGEPVWWGACPAPGVEGRCCFTPISTR
ncbi:hypothetical protein BH24GEM2_BH24GEM2_09740 [soil metagenome]